MVCVLARTLNERGDTVGVDRLQQVQQRQRHLSVHFESQVPNGANTTRYLAAEAAYEASDAAVQTHVGSESLGSTMSNGRSVMPGASGLRP